MSFQTNLKFLEKNMSGLGRISMILELDQTLFFFWTLQVDTVDQKDQIKVCSFGTVLDRRQN